MTPDEVRAVIETEIAGNSERTNDHGCNLRDCLVTPVLRPFDNGATNQQGFVQLWLVFEEDPLGENGYKIVFDEESKRFGLACPGLSGHDVYLGPYGSFWTTFDAM